MSIFPRSVATEYEQTVKIRSLEITVDALGHELRKERERVVSLLSDNKKLSENLKSFSVNPADYPFASAFKDKDGITCFYVGKNPNELSPHCLVMFYPGNGVVRSSPKFGFYRQPELDGEAMKTFTRSHTHQ